MGDLSPDLKVSSEQIIETSGGVVRPPRIRRGSIEFLRRFARFKALYNTRFNTARAELHERYRLAEIEIAKDNPQR